MLTTALHNSLRTNADAIGLKESVGGERAIQNEEMFRNSELSNIQLNRKSTCLASCIASYIVKN